MEDNKNETQEEPKADKPEEKKDEAPQEIVCHGGLSLPKMGVGA